MKILLVNNFHYLKGGSERSYFDIAQILKRNGHQVAFFSTQRKENIPTKWEKYFPQGFDLQKKNFSFKEKIRIIVKFFYNQEARKKMGKILDDFQPDLVHFHNIYHHLSPAIILETKKRNIPTVMTLHDYKLISSNYQLKKTIFERIIKGQLSIKNFLNKNTWQEISKEIICFAEKIFHKIWGIYLKVDIFIAPSAILKEKFKRAGFKGKIKVIPNFVQNIFFTNQTLKKENQEKKFTRKKKIVYFGRLEKEKGVDVLIKSLKFLQLKEIEWETLIVGDGPEREQLKKLSQKMKLKNVLFLGWKDSIEISKILDQVDLVIVPSTWIENLPFSALEAMAKGKTLIFSDEDGLKKLSDFGKRAFLFQSGNPQSLANTIQFVFSNPEISKKASLEAQNFARRNFKEEVFSKRLLTIYQKLIQKKSQEAINEEKKTLSKIRIAFIGQKGIPSISGGVEKHVEDLSVHLTKEGHKVIVYTRRNYTDPNLKEFKGVKLINLPSISTKHLDAISHTFLSVLDVVFKRKVDVVHFHSIGPSLIILLLKIFRPTLPVVFTFHTQCYLHKKWGRFARFFLKLGEMIGINLADEIITVSQNLKKYVFEKYDREAIYAPNGTVLRRKITPDEIKKKWGLEKDSYILVVSRLVRHKGIHFLIKAFKKIETNKKLVIVGEGAYTDDYVKELRKLAQKDERIIFTGLQTGKTLWELFSNAFCFVQPSQSEGLSIALLEAMSFELPVLVSDIPENLEAIKGAGKTFKNSNVESLRENLEKMIKNVKETKLLGEHACQVIAKYYCWDKISQKVIKTYQKAILENQAEKKRGLIFKKVFLSVKASSK